MTQLLPTALNNIFKITAKTSFLLVLVFMLFSKTNLNAQCIGPYARFESFSTSGTTIPPSGFTSSFVSPSLTSPVFTNSGQTPRSGNYFMLSTKQTSWLKTPSISYAKTFSFYVKTNAAATGVFSLLVEYSTDGFITPININTIAGATIPVINTTYQLVSVTLPSNTYPNVQFRITDTTNRLTSTGSLVFDDLSWDTYKSDGSLSTGFPENTIVVPAQTGNDTPTNCSGGTINVATNATYNFYDNGGPSDQYSISQTNQVTFMPVTPGDNIRVQFVSYVGAAGDKVEIWDNDGSNLGIGTNLLTHSLTTTPGTATYISSIASNGAVTVKFTSDAATNAAGFNIKVDCTTCPKPTGLSSNSVGASSANLTWDATTASNYDIYYSTSSTLMLPLASYGTLTSSATNSLSLSSLTAGATYYVWVRSNCSSTSYSSWVGPINFTTTNCTFVLNSSPSASVQNLCKDVTTATTLTASASGGIVSTYQWYSNTTATTTGGIAVGTNNASYTPLTTVAGTLYYYCIITSTLACTLTTTISGAVTITAPPASAPIATAGSAAATTSFTANWGAVSGAVGYYLDVSTTNTFATFVTGFNNLSVGNVLTYSVTGLTSGTPYFYRVRANNTCGTSISSNIISISSVAIVYCAPTYANGDLIGDSITNVTLATLNNSTGASSSPFYNFYNTVNVPNLYRGANVPISISFGTDPNQYAAVWIDFNQNSTFETSEGFVSLTNAGASGTKVITIAVPSGALLGNTRMRVRGGDDSALNATMACGASGSVWGETEDYIVNIISVPPCAVSVPSSLTFANVNANSATLIWADSAITPNTIYNYYYSTTNTAPPADGSNPVGMGTVTGGLSANISGLTLGASYYFWVRTKCDATNYSAWIACPIPFVTTNIDIVNISNSSISTCNARFYDSGGVLNNYSNNETYTYTFFPASGTNLKAVFNSFQTESNFDFLTIYDGPNTTSPSLGTYSGTQIATGQTFFSSASNGGALTFKFTTDISVMATGWDANITCVSVPTITSFSPTSTCAGTTPVVTITGTNFIGAQSVTFNGIAVIPTTVTATQIIVTLPAGATTGLIKVSTAQASVTSNSTFVIKPIPTTPNAGSDVVICSGQGTNLNVTASPATNSLTTTLIGGTSCTGGNMFDIVTNGSPITINSLDIIPNNTGLQNVNVYYKVGTYVGSETSSGSWILLGTYSVNGIAKALINMPIANLNIPATSTYGIYVNYDASYTTGNGVYSNSDITINAGAGLCGQFTGVNSPRIFNGRVYYQLSLPVTYSWSPSTGLSNATIFNPTASPLSTQTYTVTTSYNGCTSLSDSVVVTVKTTPTITASATTTPLCYSASSQTVALAYSAVTGSPLTYSITWNSSPTNSFASVTDAALLSSPIIVNVPAATPGGTYTGSLTVKNADGCVSTISTFTIIVRAQLSITTLSSATAVCGSFAQNTSLIFTSTLGSPATYSIAWNSLPANNLVPVTNVALPSNIIPISIPNGTSSGTYIGNISVQNNGCVSSSVPFTVTINTIPSVVISPPAPICFSSSSQSINISFNNSIGAPDKFKIIWGQTALDSGFTNVPLTNPLPNPITISIPANTSVGSYTGNVTVANSGCFSSSIPFTINIGKSWNGITSADWSTASNWTPSGVPTESDCVSVSSGTPYSPVVNANAFSNNLTVNTGATLIVNSGYTLKVNDVLKTYGTLTFQDQSSLYQPNDINNGVGVYNGGNIGNINYIRTTQPINRYDYNYWSTPVSSQTLFNLSPLTLSDKYFYYDAATTDYWANIASSSVMNPGQGYIIRGPQTYDLNIRQSFTGTFSGVPNNGTITTPALVSGRYNLIGNPYPSALNADLFLSNALNTSVVEGTIYLWTHNTPVNITYNAADYAVYNFTGGTATAALTGGSVTHNWNVPNGKIASGESFFIKGIGTGGNATFKNGMRISGNNDQFFKNSAVQTAENTEEKHRVWIGVSNTQGAYKEALVGYVTGATSGLDRGYDGELLSQTPACIYTLSETKALSIQGRPLPFQVSDQVPVGFHADTAGTFTISLVDYDGLFSDQEIYLEDKLWNVIQDLKSGNYNFASNTGTFEDRFVLRYTNSALNTNGSMFSEESVVVFKNNQNIAINAHNALLESVEIYDIRGRELYRQKHINSSQFEVTNFNSSQEVLLVKVTSEDGRVVTKKIIF